MPGLSSQDGAAVRLVHIVDDDAAVRESLQALLESYDYPVHTYRSAPEFLLANIGGCSGCLIADLNMPGMNGFELIEALRRSGATLPAIVITGRGDDSLRGQALKAGALALLDKPVDGNELQNAIERALAAVPVDGQG